MLKQGPPAHITEIDRLVNSGQIIRAYGFTSDYANTITWNNRLGAYLVAFWMGLIFLLIVGFGYSFFWTSATIIYLLLRRKVDDTELDEVHLEEEDDEPFAPEPPPPPAPSEPAKAAVTMVESPTLRKPPESSPPPTDGASPGHG